MSDALSSMPGVELCINLRRELQELCLGNYEGWNRKDIYTPEVKAAIDREGSNYVHPGKNPAGQEGESELMLAQRMARYLVSLRQQPAPYNEVVAVSHHVALRLLHSYIEMV